MWSTGNQNEWTNEWMSDEWMIESINENATKQVLYSHYQILPGALIIISSSVFYKLLKRFKRTAGIKSKTKQRDAQQTSDR